MKKNLINIFDYESHAKVSLDSKIADFFNCGAADQITLNKNIESFKNIFSRGEYNLQAIENGKLSALIVSYIPNGRDVFAENSKRFAMENNVNAIFGGCNFGTMSLEQIAENSFNKIKDDNFKD